MEGAFGFYFILFVIIIMGICYISFPVFFHEISENRRTRGSLFGRLLDLQPRPFTDGYRLMYRIMGVIMIIGAVIAANLYAYYLN